MNQPEGPDAVGHLTVFVDAPIVDGEPVVVDVEVQVTTARSVWVIRPDRFNCFPRSESPRPGDDQAQSTPVGDGEWVPIRAAWWCLRGGTLRVRVVPADRPAEACGIISSPVVEWTGR